MLQDFTARTDPSQGPERLARLRAEMAREGLQGFIVPRADAHQGEWVAPHDDRLAWLTGFTGSAGFLIALEEAAGLFVDGRYRVQVKFEVDTTVFTPVPWPETRPADWLRDKLTEGGKVGFDPWLHTPDWIARLEDRLEGSDIVLVPLSENLVDRIWEDQPPPPCGKLRVWPGHLAGKSHDEKRRLVAADLAAKGEAAAVLTLPDSIAWLLNIRGSDIPRTPIPHAFAVLHADATVDLFIHPDKVTAEVAAHLGAEVRRHPPETLIGALARLEGLVRIDPETAPLRLWHALEAGTAVPQRGPDPCLLPKARKNPAEIRATTAAHERDGVAMALFLHWLDERLARPDHGLDEIAIVRRLEEIRARHPLFEDISFETICGAGEHGAIVHYRVTERTNRPVRPGELVLIDSGAQYADGTTDITRTVLSPPADAIPRAARDAFTRVLKGMIALTLARWPAGRTGADLDPIARGALWRAGLDYDHGTGHGVGVNLAVHEGPQRISRTGSVPLETGMILSNEPGHYREGKWGIRIENLVVVREAEAEEGRRMLGFDTLTLAPIDRRLILPELLDAEERAWLDAYHARVFEAIAPHLPEESRAWLAEVTRPL